jgi:hypothetical protein
MFWRTSGVLGLMPPLQQVSVAGLQPCGVGGPCCMSPPDRYRSTMALYTL